MPHEKELRSVIDKSALEKIIEKRNDPARRALIWQNAFFGSSRLWRRKVAMPVYNHATNAPLTLHPEILEEVLRYVFLPKKWLRHVDES